MYRKEIDDYFEAHRDELFEDIKRLVEIPSVRGEAEPGMPFGEGPAKALALALSMAEGYGFAAKNHENYVGTADLNGKETKLGILAHLDVVGEGTGWTVCEPFHPVFKDGKLYGRGVSDDKGPAVAALYAMRAVRELGIPLQYNVRLILGTDEESGSSDIAYYFRKEAPPPMVFTPDSDFPVINTEKGRLNGAFRASWPKDGALPRIVSIQGGYRLNVVPPEAEALTEGLSIDEARSCCARAEAETGAKFTLEETPQGVRIFAHGAGAHASTPEKGNNAVTALIHALLLMPFAPSTGLERLRTVNAMFPHGDGLGRAAGIAAADEVSGELTANFSLFHFGEEGLEGEFDSRTPLCADGVALIRGMQRKFAGAGMEIGAKSVIEPHHTPPDSPLIRALLAAYEEFTGCKGECLSTGGGTYVHGIPGGVACGCVMPGIDTNMHGADEFSIAEDLVTSAKIFARAIVSLCG